MFKMTCALVSITEYGFLYYFSKSSINVSLMFIWTDSNEQTRFFLVGTWQKKKNYVIRYEVMLTETKNIWNVPYCCPQNSLNGKLADISDIALRRPLRTSGERCKFTTVVWIYDLRYPMASVTIILISKTIFRPCLKPRLCIRRSWIEIVQLVNKTPSLV